MGNNITIIGGGIVGASAAYHLASTGNAGDIVVVERDRTYEKKRYAKRFRGYSPTV